MRNAVRKENFRFAVVLRDDRALHRYRIHAAWITPGVDDPARHHLKR